MHRFIAHRAAFPLSLLVLTGLVVAGSAYWSIDHEAARVSGCASGFHLERDSDNGDADADAARCVPMRHPESKHEMAKAGDAWAQKLGTAPPGALRRATERKAQLKAMQSAVANAGNAWMPAGTGPLIDNDARYGSVNADGFANLSGRVDSFAYDPATLRVFALPGNGGLWTSTDFGMTWTSIGDALPTQNNGAVAWSSAGGGTVIVLSGNSDFLGSPAFGGLGAFWSSDLGKTWNQSTGIPDGIYSFALAVDHTAPNIVYAATSRGLFRSTDTGHTFVNVNLPTSSACAGSTSLGPCQFANVVTSVVVQEPGGSASAKGGAVLAAVGYQEGIGDTFSDGTVVSPGNGLYGSTDGTPGSFTKIEAGAANTNLPNGFAPDNRIGRVDLSVAKGADQDHGYVYALVQDAILFKGGLPGIDVNPLSELGVALPVGIPTVFNGLYISADFGQTWTRAAQYTDLANPANGSALAAVESATGYGPGIQAWYNLWIESDPTVTATGTGTPAPARLFFGLEEIWSSATASLPQDGTATLAPNGYHVIGSYYAGTECLILNPACASQQVTNASGLTTHPDQHGHLAMPDGSGGLYLFVGSDGGVWVQHQASGGSFDNASWGTGNQAGFNTLLPYDIAVAKDNTIWFGLQDNGSGKIDPADNKIYETYGGDGFYVAVDPDNSQTAYEEYANGDISVTTDGGQTWTDMNPSVSNPNFSNPFFMDPTDPKHILTGGSNIVDTVDGPTTCTDPTGTGEDNTCTWATLFTLPLNPDNSQQELTSAFAVYGDNMYAAWCGVCYIFHHGEYGVHAGIATNVGGSLPPKKHAADGWHLATAAGLPNRYVNWIALDPADTTFKTIYLAIGDYSAQQLAPPGSYLDATTNNGGGHVYKSTDGGESFTDISGDLPDIPAMTVALVNGQLLVGTQIGAFISSDVNGSAWAPLGTGLPNVPVTSIVPSPADPTQIFASTYGRSIWSYKLAPAATTTGGTSGGTSSGGSSSGGGTSGTSGGGTSGTSGGGTSGGSSSGGSSSGGSSGGGSSGGGTTTTGGGSTGGNSNGSSGNDNGTSGTFGPWLLLGLGMFGAMRRRRAA